VLLVVVRDHRRDLLAGELADRRLECFLLLVELHDHDS
jgi:hypothetical protein